jgi:hypothetical protein
MSTLPSINSENRRWLVQSYGVRRLRLRILLAVQEGNHRFALLESFGLHILGHQALVAEEEAALAARYARGSASHDSFSRRNRRASHDNR